MSVIEIKTPVAKESYELALALAKLVIEAKKAMADGIALNDVAPLMAAIMSTEVMAGIQGLDQIDDEWASDPSLVINAFSIAGAMIMKELKK